MTMPALSPTRIAVEDVMLLLVPRLNRELYAEGLPPGPAVQIVNLPTLTLKAVDPDTSSVLVVATTRPLLPMIRLSPGPLPTVSAALVLITLPPVTSLPMARLLIEQLVVSVSVPVLV